MLVTEVSSSFDPTLPLLIPDLPNSVDSRWVADSFAVDGSVSSWTDVYAGKTAIQGTAGLQPTVATVDGLRALTFDGSDDYLATNVDLSAQTEFTFYLVARVPTIPGSNKIGLDATSGFLGVAGGKWCFTGTTNTAFAPTAIDTSRWYAVAGAAKKIGSGTSIARVVTSVDTAGVENATVSYATAFSAMKIVGNAAPLGMIIREASVKVGTAHTLSQMAANVAALKTEYGIA